MASHVLEHTRRDSHLMPTFYDSRRTLRKILDSVRTIIEEKQLESDEYGFVFIDELCAEVHARHPRLSYLNRNHIVELYFKDPDRRILISGTGRIKLRDTGGGLPTFYDSRGTLGKVLDSVYTIIEEKQLEADELGFIRIDDLCAEVCKKHPGLSCLNRNHIVELYFKDPSKKILISGIDRIKLRDTRYVEPPELLYFGTLEFLKSPIALNGIKSLTKGYVRLHETPDEACQYAEKFRKRPGDKTACLEIEALRAYENGTKFSTYNNREYIVKRIHREYIRSGSESGRLNGNY